MQLRRDLIVGAAITALAIAMIIATQGFPRIRAMPYGPDLFPRIIAGGLILSAIGIVIEGLRSLRAGAAEAGAPPAPRVTLGAFAFVAVAALVAGFALLLPLLGFHLAAALVLLCAVPIFGGSLLLAVFMAAVVPFALHYVFYSLMRVVLPWGVLTPYAW
ncbi:tripartite tricarboxylate transporter TctB family protein [Roseinatronobacter alkalisoli]|uniref:Tripartite tricarboxylate transporter TctB family protein n=1 Tax=Roseinatronobacter alkalisoli TaxID=3028235 RepID=A0ABT5TC56_9RHOB|nr:tripartite tricarboxylate transporter TctB family protein [Roseinatronobacter sp. HJB301]MDD7972700.1 tripartite tricarboxylate transporter TctB family protein [Roseinatronobacter sp. HJB301]